MTGPLVIGVDVGGTKISSAIATEDGVTLVDSTAATDPAGGRAVVDQIVREVSGLCGALGIVPADVAATGLGVAGVLDHDGLVTDAPNVGLDGHELVLALEERLGHAIVVDNDVNLAALAEHRHGHGRSVMDLAFVAVGTGIGMGLIVGGSIVRGSRGAAGEIGKLPFGTDALDPLNHRRGPLEEAVSGQAVATRYRQQAGEALSVPEIFSLAERGDPAASTVLDHEAALLARAIVSVVAVVDPAVVVCGGGLGSRPLLVELVQRWLPRFGHGAIDVRVSELGPAATMIGAADLARARGATAAGEAVVDMTETLSVRSSRWRLLRCRLVELRRLPRFRRHVPVLRHHADGVLPHTVESDQRGRPGGADHRDGRRHGVRALRRRDRLVDRLGGRPRRPVVGQGPSRSRELDAGCAASASASAPSSDS